jgi:hypothetical protein
MVLINFHFIQDNDTITPAKDKHNHRVAAPQGTLAAGEWFPVETLVRNGTGTTKSSTLAPIMETLNRDCDSFTVPRRNHEARIDFDMNGSPEFIFLRDCDCDCESDDWSMSTLGRGSDRYSLILTTPMMTGTF